MKKRVRIKDVAERAGVSTGTVDRVIHKRGKVAKEVKEKVLAVIAELGFKRNQFASALASNRNIRVSVLLPKNDNELYWQSSYRGLEKASKFIQPQ